MVNPPLVPALKGYKVRICIKKQKQRKKTPLQTNEPKHHTGVKEHMGRMGGMFMLEERGITGSFQSQNRMETKQTTWSAKATGKAGTA